jgi:hypothetical protein
VNGEAFRAGVLLWCAAWHQVPAASLPDNDTELANLAGYGRVVKEWRKVRDRGAGRLREVLGRAAVSHRHCRKGIVRIRRQGPARLRAVLERMRKENKAREKEGKPAFGIPSQEQWNSGAYPHGIPPTTPPETDANSGQIPPENALKGNRTERNRTELISVPDGTGGVAAKPAGDLTKAELWWAGKSLLPSRACQRRSAARSSESW